MEYFELRLFGVGPARPVLAGSDLRELVLLPENAVNWLLRGRQMQYLVDVERDLGIPLPQQELMY